MLVVIWLGKSRLDNGWRLAVEESRMSAHVEEHFAGSNKLFVSIWGWLILLTLIEIFVAYFMHMKFERLSLILTIVPMLVICICLLFVFFPDSFRSAGLRYQFKEQPPPATEEH